MAGASPGFDLARYFVSANQRANAEDNRRASAVSEPVVLINVFEVPVADAEQFVAAWEKTRDYLQSYPAHLDTALHQALTPDADFQFVNIAHWRSAEEFTEAVSSPGFREASADLRWRFHPALYRVARTQVRSP